MNFTDLNIDKIAELAYQIRNIHVASFCYLLDNVNFESLSPLFPLDKLNLLGKFSYLHKIIN